MCDCQPYLCNCAPQNDIFGTLIIIAFYGWFVFLALAGLAFALWP